MGIVEINIKEPWERNLEYERLLKEEFDLKNIRVIHLKNGDEAIVGKVIQKHSVLFGFCGKTQHGSGNIMGKHTV